MNSLAVLRFTMQLVLNPAQKCNLAWWSILLGHPYCCKLRHGPVCNTCMFHLVCMQSPTFGGQISVDCPQACPRLPPRPNAVLPQGRLPEIRDGVNILISWNEVLNLFNQFTCSSDTECSEVARYSHQSGCVLSKAMTNDD